jgi:chromosome segregation ATPase
MMRIGFASFMLLTVALTSSGLSLDTIADTLTVNPQDLSLLQTTSRHVTKLHNTPSFDHMHIVCHDEGCAEVKARLANIEKRVVDVKAKLEECGRNRKKLEADLGAAAKERGKAEAALAECAADRKKLSEDLAQCGKDRAEAERGLAQCSRERAKLEAELTQCATVDRPNAEKGLAKCAVERAALEKQLVSVIAKLKGQASGGSTPPKKSSRHRRRRRRSKASLVETDTETEDESEAESVQNLTSRKSEIEAQLETLRAQGRSLEESLSKINEQENKAMTMWNAMSAKFFNFWNKSEKNVALEKTVKKRMDELASKEKAEVAKLDINQRRMMLAKRGLMQADKKANDAQKDLNKEALSQLSAQKKLLSLLAEVHHLKQEEAKGKHKRGSEKLGQLSTAIEAKRQSGADEEECDDLRAQVITAQGKLQEASQGLQVCLKTKKEIQRKLDAVESARARAQKGLDHCLATKERLKTALEECHKRRDSAREKLQACLDRKKELKPKIEACHVKRDEARKKLAECLTKKKELKAKIAAAMAKLGPQKRSSLLELTDEMSGVREILEQALEDLKAANADFDITAQEIVEVGNTMKRSVQEMIAASQEDDAIMVELNKIDQMEFHDQQGAIELGAELEDALEALQKADRLSDAATVSAQVAEDAVAKVETSLLALDE